jgi:hypothetical protein
MAHERGFGPLDLKQITISGDVTLQEAQQRAKGFKVGLIRVEKYFEGTNITAYAGPPPASEGKDYCWGGCPGAIEEAVEILRLMDKEIDTKMPRLHVVFGAYDGPLDVKPGEKVAFIGDCAQWKGQIGEKLISIESLYKTRDTLDPHTVKGEDVLAKMWKTRGILKEGEKGKPMRLQGCPVSVAEHVLLLAGVSNAEDPAKDASLMGSYLKWKAVMAGKALLGHKYQLHGAAKRGEAAPDVTPHSAE